jgi:hypothetical protein
MEFRLTKSKRDAFDALRDTFKHRQSKRDGDVFVKLSWDALVALGSHAQLLRFDALRNKYVTSLLDKHCRALGDGEDDGACTTDVIGSTSPSSDIDINMTSPAHFEDVYTKILREHRARFPHDSLEDMFDVNIYGSVFHFLDARCQEDGDARRRVEACYPMYEPSYRQRMWSFLRIVESTQGLRRGQAAEVVRGLPAPYQRLYERTRKVLLGPLRKRYGSSTDAYAHTVQAYLDELKKPHPVDIPEKFALAKYLERDTYRSIGAVLHIVEHKPTIVKANLYDSVYDNLGFIYQLAFKDAASIDVTPKIGKICKYIARVCDAVQRIQGRGQKTPLVAELQALAKELDAKRKALAPIEPRKVEALLGILGSTIAPRRFVLDTTLFFFRVMPKDPLL